MAGMPTDELIAVLTDIEATSRFHLWAEILARLKVRRMVEVGVWKGDFAAHLLRHCPTIEHYIMLDSWRHLADWNKPANVDEETFAAIHQEAMDKTQFAAHRRVVLRGTTLEMCDKIADESLDFAYIDRDHTLRGITIDLIRIFPKIRPGGILGGDDYTRSVWQHPDRFEPTLICPFAAYFAESQRVPIVVLDHEQFAIVKSAEPGDHFRVIETVPGYGERALMWQVAPRDRGDAVATGGGAERGVFARVRSFLQRKTKL